MEIYSKQRKIQVNYRPLQTSGRIEVVGSVPSVQVYQADKGEYTPDYTLTPLTLFPRCNATDPSALTVPGTVNSKLTNMQWYETIGGTRKLIESTNADYEITTDGTNKGQLKVKKNVSPTQALTLDFYGEYVDSGRSGQTYVFRYTYLVRTVDGTEAAPVLMIDCPAGRDWNPLRDQSQQTITAKMIVADVDVTTSGKCKFFFYRVLDTGALQAITSTTGDNDWEVVSVSANQLTVDMDYIGHEQSYVVKASYDAGGSPASQPDYSIAYKSTTLRRRIPALDVDYSGVPGEVPGGTTAIYPEAVIRDTLGTVPTPEAVLECSWLTKVGAGSYALKAQGMSVEIPYQDGMMLEMQVADRGPWAAVVDSSGKYVTDSQGRPLVARKSN
jgi:hypothetical protein